MRFLRTGVLAWIALMSASCSPWQERFLRWQENCRDELARLYPVGSPFEPIEDRLFGPFESWVLTTEPPSELARFLRSRVRQTHESAVACWHGWVPRLTIGSSLGAMGIWHDYVFVDSNERVLVAFREFLD